MKLKQTENLGRLLNPSQIAFIGGSDAEVAINEALRRGFSGSIWPVNPKRDHIAGHKCYRSVMDLPFGPDAVFLAIPANQVLKTIKELRQVLAGGIVCYTAGFRETGYQGTLKEQRLVAALGEMVMVGPNCYGVINYLKKSALWPFAHGGFCPGYGAAIITQSGMLSSDITMCQRSLPLTHMISVGNQASLKSSDFIKYLIDSRPVRAFGLHVESIDDVHEFETASMQALKAGKPIVLLKTGTSQIGANLTESHTGSFAGSHEMYNAFFERLGIITVSTPSELIETLKLICISGVPRGKKCMAFTCSGGGATLVADLGEKLDLKFPKFSKRNLKAVAKLLPAIATVSNPLDYTTPIWGKKEFTKPLFDEVTRKLEFDFAFLLQDYPLTGLDDTKIHYLTDGIAFAESVTEKKVPGAIISTISENIDEQTRVLLLGKGVAPLQGLADALQALAKTSTWALNRKKILERSNLTLFREGMVKGFSYLDEWEAKNLISEAGTVIPRGVKSNSEQILSNAKKIGFPLVIKLLNKDLLHKTEHGAVCLNIQNELQVREAVQTIRRSITSYSEHHYTDHFLLEEMVDRPICELIVGIKRDQQFGVVMTLGSGGVFADLFDDYKLLLLPVNRDEILSNIMALKIGKLLTGYRGLTHGCWKTVVDCVETLIVLFLNSEPSIVELEINPLFVFEKTVMAIDVLVATEDTNS